MQKYPVLPSQLSGSFYDSTVPHLPSTAVDFLQFLPSYWVIRESRMLKLRGTWVTSSVAPWPAWKFYKDCQFCKPNQFSLLRSPRQAVNYCCVRVMGTFFKILMIWSTLAWDHHILWQRLLTCWDRVAQVVTGLNRCLSSMIITFAKFKKQTLWWNKAGTNFQRK